MLLALSEWGFCLFNEVPGLGHSSQGVYNMSNSSDLGLSRRRFGAGLVAGLVALAAGQVFYRKRKNKFSHNIRDLPGTPFAVPGGKHISYVFNVALSPDGRKVCVVHGNLTRKVVSVADFPVKRSDAFRRVAEFTNCYKVDGISWSSFDPTCLACKLTCMDTTSTLPDVTTEGEWRALGASGGIKEKDLYGELVLFFTNKVGYDRVCRLPPSLEESQTASSTWVANDTVFCYDQGHLTKVDFSRQDKPEVIFDWNLRREKGTSGAIHDIAWSPSRGECVAVAFVDKKDNIEIASLSFGRDGGMTGDLTTLITKPQDSQFSQLLLSGNGNNMATIFAGDSVMLRDTVAIPKWSLLIFDLMTKEEKVLALDTSESVSLLDFGQNTALLSFVNMFGDGDSPDIVMDDVSYDFRFVPLG